MRALCLGLLLLVAIAGEALARKGGGGHHHHHHHHHARGDGAFRPWWPYCAAQAAVCARPPAPAGLADPATPTIEPSVTPLSEFVRAPAPPTPSRN